MLDAANWLVIVAAIATALCAGAGAWWASKSSIAQTAASNGQILETRVSVLESQNRDQADTITALLGEISILKNLVTQKADVQGVREVVDRIAVKIGA
jgi:hypothetical protein